MGVMPFSACEFGYYRPHEFELPPAADRGAGGCTACTEATLQVRFPGDYVLILTQPQPDDPSERYGGGGDRQRRTDHRRIRQLVC